MNDFCFYLSSSTKPHCGKAAPIQKGLVPTTENGRADLCEEGLGFGVPLLQYARDFFFPGTSAVSHEGTATDNAWKAFDLNLIERQQRGHDSRIHTFSWVYQRIYNRMYKEPVLRRAMLLTQGIPLSRAIERQAPNPLFFRVASKGRVPVSYRISDRFVDVSVDFSGIDRRGLQHIYLSNEMGGTLFDHYEDDSGMRLHGNEIGGWQRIRSRWAGFVAPRRGIAFKVEIPDGAYAFAGREIIPPDIRWSGVTLQLPPSCSGTEYRISFRTRMGA